MRNELSERLSIDVPIFAFSHCRDVVREVSLAGGFGVLGVNMHTPDRLRDDLRALEKELRGKPYGVDVLYPGDGGPAAGDGLMAELPEGHKEFMIEVGAAAGAVPGWAAAYDDASLPERSVNTTQDRTGELIEVCLEFSPALLVSALRPLPARHVERLHERGVLVGGMVGSARHAVAHVAAGADVIIAQGAEAGGHTGDIGTLVLVPEVVAAVPVPVLAAGGFVTGRQLAAAYALGAAGIWAGSLWLTSVESDLEVEVVEKLLAASSADTVKTRAFTGKPCRSLTESFVDSWASDAAPPALPMPYQELLIRPLLGQLHKTRKVDYMGTPVGQGVGLMTKRKRCAEIVADIAVECESTLSELAGRRAT